MFKLALVIVVGWLVLALGLAQVVVAAIQPYLDILAKVAAF